MAKTTSLHFYPERIAWIGSAIAAAGLLLALPLVIMLHGNGIALVSFSGRKGVEIAAQPVTFSLGLNNRCPVLPMPDLQGEMTFSFDPPRPIGCVDGKRLLVRMKRSASSKRVVLPCRLDLEFQDDTLGFAKGPSPFWIELSQAANGNIEGKVFISSVEGEKMDAGSFLMQGQECPLQTAQEFAGGSPFHLLAEARWWGRDQFIGREDGGERLEVGNTEFLELKEDDWLIWKDQKWQKSGEPAKDQPIAHIQSASGKGLILEGWDADGHIRISLTAAAGPPFKTRGEDLFTSIRVRSEKQISCMMEKQCLVLKTNDWVFKMNGRWKVLRKKEERDAFINGKLFGELFVFEQIAQKQGQKMIQGRLFNPGRTQVVAIEMSAQSTRKAKDRKGRAP